MRKAASLAMTGGCSRLATGETKRCSFDGLLAGGECAVECVWWEWEEKTGLAEGMLGCGASHTLKI